MENPALLIIDLQQGFDNPAWGNRNNPAAEANIARLLATWRRQNLPVIHVRHASTEPNSPLRPDAPGFAFKPEAEPLPTEKQFQKNVNSAFIGTGLEVYLRAKGISALVIAGLTTDHCVSTTTRMAGNLGFDVTLVSDATATFDRTAPDGTHFSAEIMHKTQLASLNGEFCAVQSTESVLKIWGAS